MPIKPGPQLITVGGTNLLADDIRTTYTTEFFDRVEFDHDKLKTAPLSTGVTPIIVQLLGNIPAEIVIDCALTGMIGGASSYIPRPVTPNLIPTVTNQVKQRINIVRWTITGGSTPESSSLGSNVDTVFATSEVHKDKLAQFQNRIAIFSGQVAYEQLIAAQIDNIQSLYFSTGMSFTGPGISISDCLITDFNYGLEYAIFTDNTSTNYDIRKGFTMTLEQRTVTAASAA